MAFIRASSPHTHVASTTGDVMRWVILATLPGFIALTYFFGWGTLINLVLASMVAYRIRYRHLDYFSQTTLWRFGL